MRLTEIGKDEFKAKLDGSLEQKLLDAFMEGYHYGWHDRSSDDPNYDPEEAMRVKKRRRGKI